MEPQVSVAKTRVGVRRKPGLLVMTVASGALLKSESLPQVLVDVAEVRTVEQDPASFVF